MPAPAELRTERLLLRRWHPDDALALAPVLVANAEHLRPWVPQRVIGPAPAAALAERLSGFSATFDATREWRWGIFDADDGTVLGEISLFPRDAAGRVPYESADRAEIGYWVRMDRARGGVATEAARAALDVARSLPRIARVEIRCDARNVPSAALPRRLGFTLEETIADEGVLPGDGEIALQVWVLDLTASRTPRSRSDSRA